MASIEDVADIIERMTNGFENCVMGLLEDNKDDAVRAIHEQLYSGMDGEGEYLSPTYLTDPYFSDPDSPWFENAMGYKIWKETITPPASGLMLNTPPRPDDVPNLYITGKFYSQIRAERQGDVLHIDEGTDLGPDIVAKYGDQILQLGDTAIKYFNVEILTPGIWSFFEDCGW